VTGRSIITGRRKRDSTKSKVKCWIFVFSLLVLWSSAEGAGTAAGTAVSNSVTIRFQIAGSAATQTIESNTDTFVVDRVADVRIDWMDTAPVEAGPGESDRVLRFLVSNLGNGDDNVSLSYEHNTTDSFSPPPQNVRLYRDSDGDGVFDPSSDSQVSLLPLAEDANATVFIVADIPSNPDSNLSRDGIRVASSWTATAGPEDPQAVDVVVRRGEDLAEGIYRLRDYHLESYKSATIHSSDGQVHTGTRITYTIGVTLKGGAGAIHNVIVSDTIPTGTEYLPGTLTLDGTALSDAADGDAGSYDSAQRLIRVDLGTLSQSAPGETSREIAFEVKVQ